MNPRNKIVLVGIYDTNTVSLAPYVLKLYVQQFDVAHNFQIVTKEFSIFSDSIEVIANTINEERPAAVGFSAYIWNINEILEVIKYLDATIIIGGPQVTGIEEKLLCDNPNIDIIVTGEGEETFKELLEYFNDNGELEAVRGITSRKVKNLPRPVLADLNAVPFVYEHIFCEHPDITWISFETSRGCPMGCKFCTWGYSKKMRYYPVDRVKKELDVILSQKKINDIYLCDSSLLLNMPRAKEILQYIIDSKTDKQIRFEFSTEQLDDEIINLLSQMPNHEFNFGLQSINTNAVKEMGRGFNKAKFWKNYQKIVNIFKESNITIDVIYGLPGDDIEGYKETLDYAISLKGVRRIITNPLIVLPGSPFFYEMDKYGIKLKDDKCFLVKETRTFSAEQIQLARRYSFYVSIIFLNLCLVDCIKSLADSQDVRYIDIIIKFGDGLALDIVGGEYPDMVPVIKDGFFFRNSVFGRVIEKYDEIINCFNVFSNFRYTQELADYPEHFSDQYYKLKKFIWAKQQT